MNFNRKTQQLEQNKIDFKFFQLTAVLLSSFTHKSFLSKAQKSKNEKVYTEFVVVFFLLN